MCHVFMTRGDLHPGFRPSLCPRYRRPKLRARGCVSGRVAHTLGRLVGEDACAHAPCKMQGPPEITLNPKAVARSTTSSLSAPGWSLQHARRARTMGARAQRPVRRCEVAQARAHRDVGASGRAFSHHTFRTPRPAHSSTTFMLTAGGTHTLTPSCSASARRLEDLRDGRPNLPRGSVWVLSA